MLCGESRHIGNVLQITCADTNRSSFATKLKIGTTALVLQMLEDGWEPPNLDLSRQDIVRSIRSVATDENHKWLFETGIGEIPAIEVQRTYLLEALKRFFGRDEDTNWVLKNWAAVLNQLETNPMKADVLDWVAKKKMLDRLAAKGLTEEELIKADLGYHAVDPRLDLALVLKVPLPTQEEVEHAVLHPPNDTRAAGRGILVAAISSKISKASPKRPIISWNIFQYLGYSLPMSNPFNPYLPEAQKIASHFSRLEGKRFSPERK